MVITVVIHDDQNDRVTAPERGLDWRSVKSVRSRNKTTTTMRPRLLRLSFLLTLVITE